MTPPATTAGTAPSSEAATPDSKAPSSFEALMKTDSTAVTRPRSSLGAATTAIVLRMFTLTMSTPPATARATTESGSDFESPNTMVATPKAPTTTSSVVPVRPPSGPPRHHDSGEQRADGGGASQHAEPERPGVEDLAREERAAARSHRRTAPRTGRA